MYKLLQSGHAECVLACNEAWTFCRATEMRMKDESPESEYLQDFGSAKHGEIRSLYKKRNMIMKEITIRDEFIKLGQAMKLADMVSGGGEAKEVILSGEVKVNGETELRRGRKLRPGDVFSYNNEEAVIK